MRLEDLSAEELARLGKILSAAGTGDVGSFAAEAVAVFVTSNPDYAPLAPLAADALAKALTGQLTLVGRVTRWVASWF